MSAKYWMVWGSRTSDVGRVRPTYAGHSAGTAPVGRGYTPDGDLGPSPSPSQTPRQNPRDEPVSSPFARIRQGPIQALQPERLRVIASAKPGQRSMHTVNRVQAGRSAVLALVPFAVVTLALAQDVGDGFDPGANRTVEALALQPDGKVLLGGEFTELGGMERHHVGRVQSDGSLDLGFNPRANGRVSALSLQPDGSVVLGGSFTQVGGVARQRIARVHPDGSLDAAFNPGANNAVNAVKLQVDGKVLLGGRFSQVDGQPRMNIARLHPDGTVDSGFNPGASSDVMSLVVQADGKVLVGGLFSQVAGQPRQGIARLLPDGSLDADFAPATNGAIVALAVQADGKILLGGTFNAVEGQQRRGIARLHPDGSLDLDFAPSFINTGTFALVSVSALVVQPDGKVLVGGSFAEVDGETRLNTARLLPDGSLDTVFDAGMTDAAVVALARQGDGKILVGGRFSLLGGQRRLCVGRLQPDGGVEFDPGPIFADRFEEQPRCASGFGASDRRLKTGVVPLYKTPAGIQLYSFRYLGGQTTFTGPMAQDLLADPRHAHAVHRGSDGYYRVDYEALGLPVDASGSP
ncbi:MAG: hypothetical protein EA418_12565 [Wenzhouxiangellaceae bacterium]|nr:MAG: hypothetical protein EA418_12565 [Wenzhouxiangellaceae bacterium]